MKVKIITLLLTFFAVVLLLLFSFKNDNRRTVNYQSSGVRNTTIGGLFESSGSSSRYALTEAIVEDGTLFLNDERARFASPDIAEYDNKYFSLFTPGVSFAGVPFYWLGKQFGEPQLFTFGLSSLISILSVFVVAKIARKLGTGIYSSLMAGIIFLFATNALSYSLTFTQHPLSALLVLLSVLSAIGQRTFINNLWFGGLYGFGILVDISNGVLMLPLVLYVLYKHLKIIRRENDFSLRLKLNFTGLLMGLIPLLFLFGWYNYQLTGSYTKIAQMVGISQDFTTEPIEENPIVKKNKILFQFSTTNQVRGFYTLIFSDERGVFYYSPVLLIGVFGFYLLRKHKDAKEKVILLAAVILTNLILYASFVDPSGSWAFGPRYLIPGLAVSAVFIGVVIDEYKKNKIFSFVFLVLVVYSVGVNVVGAMTTTLVPPKIEAVNLANPIPYTYKYNWQLLVNGEVNSSLVYKLYLIKILTSTEYAFFYVLFVLGLISVLYATSFLEEDELLRLK